LFVAAMVVTLNLSASERCYTLFFKIVTTEIGESTYHVALVAPKYSLNDFEIAVYDLYRKLGARESRIDGYVRSIRSLLNLDYWYFDSKTGRLLANLNHPFYWSDPSEFPIPTKLLPEIPQILDGRNLSPQTEYQIYLEAKRYAQMKGAPAYLNANRITILSYDPFYGSALVEYSNGVRQVVKHSYSLSNL